MMPCSPTFSSFWPNSLRSCIERITSAKCVLPIPASPSSRITPPLPAPSSSRPRRSSASSISRPSVRLSRFAPATSALRARRLERCIEPYRSESEPRGAVLTIELLYSVLPETFELLCSGPPRLGRLPECSSGRKMGTASSLPLTLIGSRTLKSQEPSCTTASYVSLSHRMPFSLVLPAACIRRAARLTCGPESVYSTRTPSLPASPQNTRPVVMPTQIFIAW